MKNVIVQLIIFLPNSNYKLVLLPPKCDGHELSLQSIITSVKITTNVKEANFHVKNNYPFIAH